MGRAKYLDTKKLVSDKRSERSSHFHVVSVRSGTKALGLIRLHLDLGY